MKAADAGSMEAIDELHKVKLVTESTSQQGRDLKGNIYWLHVVYDYIRKNKKKTRKNVYDYVMLKRATIRYS